MSYYHFFTYDEPINYSDTDELTIQNKVFSEDETATVRLYEDHSVIVIESHKRLKKHQIPIELNRFVANRNSIFEFYRSVGLENITKFRVLRSTGYIHDAVENNTLKEFFHTEKYPVDSAEVEIDGETAEIDNHVIEATDSFPIEPLLEEFAQTISTD
jgi:hypothetical protein